MELKLSGDDLSAGLFSLYISYVLLGNKETFLVNQTVIRFLEIKGDKEEKQRWTKVLCARMQVLGNGRRRLSHFS